MICSKCGKKFTSKNENATVCSRCIRKVREDEWEAEKRQKRQRVSQYRIFDKKAGKYVENGTMALLPDGNLCRLDGGEVCQSDFEIEWGLAFRDHDGTWLYEGDVIYEYYKKECHVVDRLLPEISSHKLDAPPPKTQADRILEKQYFRDLPYPIVANIHMSSHDIFERLWKRKHPEK